MLDFYNQSVFIFFLSALQKKLLIILIWRKPESISPNFSPGRRKGISLPYLEILMYPTPFSFYPLILFPFSPHTCSPLKTHLLSAFIRSFSFSFLFPHIPAHLWKIIFFLLLSAHSHSFSSFPTYQLTFENSSSFFFYPLYFCLLLSNFLSPFICCSVFNDC